MVGLLVLVIPHFRHRSPCGPSLLSDSSSLSLSSFVICSAILTFIGHLGVGDSVYTTYELFPWPLGIINYLPNGYDASVVCDLPSLKMDNAVGCGHRSQRLWASSGRQRSLAGHPLDARDL